MKVTSESTWGPCLTFIGIGIFFFLTCVGVGSCQFLVNSKISMELNASDKSKIQPEQ